MQIFFASKIIILSAIRYIIVSQQITMPMNETLLPELSPRIETIALLKMAARIIARRENTATALN